MHQSDNYRLEKNFYNNKTFGNTVLTILPMLESVCPTYHTQAHHNQCVTQAAHPVASQVILMTSFDYFQNYTDLTGLTGVSTKPPLTAGRSVRTL